MSSSWIGFEKQVREIAGAIYSQPCTLGQVGGVDIDGVIDAADDIKVLIEITKRKDGLKKVREDVIKLRTAKDALQTQNIHARCYCIFEGDVTNAMKGAADPHGISVLSLEKFAQIFFDFDQYRNARENVAFGSAVNPLTGEKDDSDYVAVTYQIDQSKEVSVDQICGLLKQQRKIVLLGEYGSGKSRCFRQVFKELSKTGKDQLVYPFAIDLREHWGLKRWSEILRRHIDDLGLPQSMQSATVRALNTHSLILLLDGFDELGSQSWSNDSDKLKLIRSRSLEGVRDLIAKSQSGMLISGREHYFNSNDEMLSALGLKQTDVIMVRCKDEFTPAETERFLERISADIDIPTWLPRRPLVCRTIADLSEEDLDSMFGVGEDETSFFDHFIRVLSKRDARINASFDSDTIERVLITLARMTRAKPANVGPITLSDVQSAFEAVVGQMPVEEAAVMLQRLPGLGRLTIESNDRQFIDGYILDGLRAKDIIISKNGGDQTIRGLINHKITNPLDDLGQKILSKDIEQAFPSYLLLANRFLEADNVVGACDIVAAGLKTSYESFDFKDMQINEGTFVRLDMSGSMPVNLSVRSSVLGSLTLPLSPPKNTSLVDCVALRVYGVASVSALPKWIKNLESDQFDSVASVSRIKKIGLSPSHEILATIVRKTFFQKGSGRKEEALTRGLGQLATPSLTQKILSLLIKEEVIDRFKGDDGWVYTPKRPQAGRMKQMLYELKTSQDKVWLEAGTL